MAEISVIMPVWNVGRCAVAAIESLRAQSFGDFEAIVIDDGATAGSGAAAFAAAGRDRRFHLLRQDNRGLSAARNRGLDLARGGLIAFLDGDDRYERDFLGRMRAELARGGAPWVACGFWDCFPDGARRANPALYAPPPAPAPGLYRLDSVAQILAHYPSAWNKLAQRSLYAGLRFETGTWFEDHLFYQRAALRAGALRYLPAPLYLQSRARPGQITGSDDERLFQQFAVLDQIRALLLGSGRAGAEAGFAAFAARLLSERSLALRDPARRQRWLRACRTWLSRRGIRFDPEASASLAAALAGRPALALIADLGATGDFSEAALAGLCDQDIAAFDLIALRGPGPRPPRLAAFARACPDRGLIDLSVPADLPRPARWRAALAASSAPPQRCGSADRRSGAARGRLSSRSCRCLRL